ncbi:MAG: acyl-CoA thioesterase [Parahaliea sp.]
MHQTDKIADGNDKSRHALDIALDLSPGKNNSFQGEIPPTYSNFVGPYGGILAAKLLRAIQLHPEKLGEPIAVTVNYGGRVKSEAFDILVRPTCTNRSSQHWLMELQQAGEIPVTGSAVFAHRRNAWSDQEKHMPLVPSPNELPCMKTEGLTAWVANYDIRIHSGSLALQMDPPQAQTDSETLLWVRDHPSRPIDFAALMAMSDIFFPRIFVRRPVFVPAGTISITTYIHASQEELAQQADNYLLARASGNRYHKGYFDHSGELWGADGTLLATTHQVVYYKE